MFYITSESACQTAYRFFPLHRHQTMKLTIMTNTRVPPTPPIIAYSMVLGASSSAGTVGVSVEVFVVGDVLGDIVVADVGSDVDAVVAVSSMSCCTFEMVALRAEEISATEDFTIVTTTFLFITELDDPRGVCK